MTKKSRTYIWQFVIGLGFFSGLWTAVGIDPQVIIFNALGNAVYTIYADPTVRSIFIVLPVILLTISIHRAYKKGRLFGLISVIIAYLAGVLIFVSIAPALLLLGISLIIGYLAPGRRGIKF